jgi:polyisoprenoid-binding protein YceI
MKKALSLAALAIVAFAGAAFAGDKYDLKVSNASGKAGAKATATVTVKPKGDFHVNLEYPHKLILTPAEGVSVEKAKLVAADAKVSKDEISFTIAATAVAAGKKTIEAELKSAVCSADSCMPFTEKVTIQVEAK